MAKPFQYDMSTLIELVRNRPCIWDKNMDTFKDRTEKQKAWDEICVNLDSDFFIKDKHEQRRICELVNGKWQNVRDAFVKSLKKQSIHPNMRKYIYHNKLKFLLKVFQRDEEESKLYSRAADGESSEDAHETRNDDACGQRKKLRLQEDIDQEILKALRTTKAAPDEDEAFFISITPTIRRMSEFDKLEFRMGVLQLIKDINSRGKDLPDSAFFSGSSASSSHPTNSFSHYPNPNADADDFGQETQLFKCE